jgi:hypothetical protein
MKPTIGQRILAACLAHQLGIHSDRALKLYVLGHDIDPSWETVGETLLKSAVAATTPQRESRPHKSGNVH